MYIRERCVRYIALSRLKVVSAAFASKSFGQLPLWLKYSRQLPPRLKRHPQQIPSSSPSKLPHHLSYSTDILTYNTNTTSPQHLPYINIQLKSPPFAHPNVHSSPTPSHHEIHHLPSRPRILSSVYLRLYRRPKELWRRLVRQRMRRRGGEAFQELRERYLHYQSR
jgi:hypothetical protein